MTDWRTRSCVKQVLTLTPQPLGPRLKKEEAKNEVMSPHKNGNMCEVKNDLLRMKPTMKGAATRNPQSEPQAVRAACYHLRHRPRDRQECQAEYHCAQDSTDRQDRSRQMRRQEMHS